MVTGNGKLM